MSADSAGEESSRLLTYTDVAKLCQVSTRTVKRWVKDGKLHSIHLGDQVVRFSNAEVLRFISAGQRDVTL